MAQANPSLLAAMAAGAVGLVATLLFVVGLHTIRRRWLLADIPASSVKGVFVGLNEVRGTVRTDAPLYSRLCGLPCVWYHVVVEELAGSTDGGDLRWVTASNETHSVPFWLEDATGTIPVLPAGAEVRGERSMTPVGTTETMGGSRRRYREYVIETDRPVLVLGPARMSAEDGVLEIAADGGPFHIAAGDEAELRRGFGLGGTVGLVVGLLVATTAPVVGGAVGRFVQGSVDGEPIGVLAGVAAAAAASWPVAPLAIALAYVALVGLAYLVHLYNRLVGLTQRAGRAWSLIDVQLRRRHDLIPALATCVAGYAGAEARSLTELRLPALDGGDRLPSAAALHDTASAAAAQSMSARSLLAVAEAHPDLRADRSFRRLREDLADTEDRVALARTFYNDSVTLLADRAGTFPWLLVAPIVGVPTFELFHFGSGAPSPVG